MSSQHDREKCEWSVEWAEIEGNVSNWILKTVVMCQDEDSSYGHASCPDGSCFTITNVEKQFAGKFICSAENSVGTAQATIQLRVMCE